MTTDFGAAITEPINPEPQYATWADLRADLDANRGVLCVSMLDLRTLKEAGRLGQHVRAAISRDLAGMGIGHASIELPQYQEHYVVLYKLGTPAAEIVEAVKSGATDQATTVLRRVNMSGDAEKVLAISEKVDELYALLHEE